MKMDDKWVARLWTFQNDGYVSFITIMCDNEQEAIEKGKDHKRYLVLTGQSGTYDIFPADSILERWERLDDE